MTTHFATRLMPAGTTQKSHPTQDRREVNTVALLDLFRDAKRVSNQSDVEKALRLESVRRRRQLEADKAAHLAAFHGHRIR